MKVVILDPYFETLGGGEKVVSVMAEHLSQKHEVVILVDNEISKEKVNKYFDVDLTNVDFELIPDHNLFVKFITYHRFRVFGRWKSLVYDYSSLKMLKRIKADLFINNLYQSNLSSPAKKSIYMCMFPQKIKLEDSKASVARKIYNFITKIIETILLGSREKALKSYSVVTANSKYTSSWIKNYWDIKSSILYPVCDYMGPPLKKEKIIMGVGRFFADNGSSHHKRHDLLIKSFIELGHDDWELHLCGSLGEDKDSKNYFKKLQKLSIGKSNIHLHPNKPFDDIKELYKKASIFWHATGFGYDSEEFPENQEHFGITTVEAMSAGVVPVVYGSAGQKEIVTNEIDGLLWLDIDELKKQTLKLINSPSLTSRLQKKSILRAVDFSRENFVLNLNKIIDRL